jgi:hypothetical protein
LELRRQGTDFKTYSTLAWRNLALISTFIPTPELVFRASELAFRSSEWTCDPLQGKPVARVSLCSRQCPSLCKGATPKQGEEATKRKAVQSNTSHNRRLRSMSNGAYHIGHMKSHPLRRLQHLQRARHSVGLQRKLPGGTTSTTRPQSCHETEAKPLNAGSTPIKGGSQRRGTTTHQKGDPPGQIESESLLPGSGKKLSHSWAARHSTLKANARTTRSNGKHAEDKPPNGAREANLSSSPRA